MTGTCSCWHTYCCQRPAWLELLLGSGKHCGKRRNGCHFPSGTPRGDRKAAKPGDAPHGYTRTGRRRQRPLKGKKNGK